MHKHYANCPYTNDETIVEGTLNVMCKQPLKFLAPFMKLMGQIPTHNEESVSVTVRFQSGVKFKSLGVAFNGEDVEI